MKINNTNRRAVLGTDTPNMYKLGHKCIMFDCAKRRYHLNNKRNYVRFMKGVTNVG